MGVAQIVLDDLDLSNIVIAWYKLFHPSSLISLPTNQQQSNQQQNQALSSRNAMLVQQSGSFG